MTAQLVTRSQAILVLAHVGRLVLFLAVAGLLGRELAPADFGFVALVTSLFLVCAELLDMGTTAVATREIAARPAGERERLAALLALRRAAATALAVAALAVAVLGDFREEGQRLAIAAAAIGLYALHLHGYQVVVQVRHAYGSAVALGIATQAGFLVASVAALKLHAGGAAIAALIAAREVVFALGMRRIGHGLLGCRLRAPWRHPGMRALLAAGWMIGLAGASYKVAAHAGGFFLWGLASAEALAVFSAAQRLLQPLSEMAWLFATPLIASMSVAAAHSAEAFRTQYRGHLKFVLGMSALAAVAGWFLAPLLLHLVYGDRYAHGTLSSVGVFRWLVVAFLFALVTPVLAVGELANGSARALLLTGGAGLAANAAMNAWAVPRLDAQGAALALCASEALVFALLLGRSVARGDAELGASWIAYLVPALLLGAVLASLDSSPALQFAVACAWAPPALAAILALPAQRACRASLAEVASAWPSPAGPLPARGDTR